MTMYLSQHPTLQLQILCIRCVFAVHKILVKMVNMIVIHCKERIMFELLTICLGLAEEDGARSGVVRWVRLQSQL